MWLLSNCFILLHSSAKQALGHKKQTTDSILSINESLQENLCRVREMGVIWNLSLSPLGSVLDRG